MVGNSGRKVNGLLGFLQAVNMLDAKLQLAGSDHAKNIRGTAFEFQRVQPALARVARSRIRLALGVSEPYSSAIQAGMRIPHPRHWLALARLVGVSQDGHCSSEVESS